MSLMILEPSRHSFMDNPALGAVFKALRAGGAQARYVGGALRDAFLGRPVADVDLAVDVPPEETAALLSAAGIKVVPTGMDYGTVMAVTEGKGYEITSLRRDVRTDGRRAVVAYTKEWACDAARRDFTINALYADEDGTVYDFIGGLADLQARRLRFIGEPEARIREDVLRILRYYRFLAQLGPTFSPDACAREACRTLALLLPSLSAERLWSETKRLLVGTDAGAVARMMQEDGVFAAFLPYASRTDRLQELIAQEAAHARPDAVRRLAALLNGGQEQTALSLKLSKEESAHLAGCVKAVAAVREACHVRAFRQIIYDLGPKIAGSATLLLLAEGRGEKREFLAALSSWENPVFPIKGRDLISHGLSHGPKIGVLLKEIELWWKEQDFVPTAEECLAMALKSQKT